MTQNKRNSSAVTAMKAGGGDLHHQSDEREEAILIISIRMMTVGLFVVMMMGLPFVIRMMKRHC